MNRILSIVVAFVIAVPLFISCKSESASKNSVEIKAEKHLYEWLDKLMMDDGEPALLSYSDAKKVFTYKSDSVLIYNVDAKIREGRLEISTPLEYYYMILPNNAGSVAAINIVASTGSIIDYTDSFVKGRADIDKNTRDQMIYISVLAAFQSDKVISHSVQ